MGKPMVPIPMNPIFDIIYKIFFMNFVSFV